MFDNFNANLNNFFNIHLAPWFQRNDTKVLIIILIAYLIQLLGGVFIEKVLLKAVKLRKGAKVSRKQRAETVLQIFRSLFTVVVLITAFFTVLATLNINIGPILAGAGFIGVAVAVGAQQLMKDLIAGFFIISENQYKIGDFICLNDGTCGVVQDVSLRLTVLRDLDGAIHYVPNSSFSHASNHSIDYTRIGLTLGVKAEEKLEQVIKVINR